MVESSDKLCDLCKPKSKIDEVTELTNEINYIKDKLDSNMTSAQKDDWRYLLHAREKKLAMVKN
jgi:hypothetical protein